MYLYVLTNLIASSIVLITQTCVQFSYIAQCEPTFVSVLSQDGIAALEKLQQLQELSKKQSEEISKLVTSFNSERLLRKKYYNMIEDMKGKIRVYCRVRPLSSSEKARVSECIRLCVCVSVCVWVCHMYTMCPVHQFCGYWW